jgi:hypothetical protein
MASERLRDLGKLAAQTRKRLDEEFPKTDIKLSNAFKNAFDAYIQNTGNSVKFNETTAEITNSSGQKIYLPNQWFLLASYAVDFVKEIVRYRNYTEACLDENANSFMDGQGKISEKKEIYKTLKTDKGNKFTGIFQSKMYAKLISEGQSPEDAEYNSQMLYRFVSDDKWWFGGKGIERTNDFYVSPVLGVLKLVNASQNYVATIAYAYVNNTDLFHSLDTMLGSSDESDLDTSEADEYQRAAKTITDHINEAGLEFDEKTKDDAEDVRNRLLERFSPEKLKALPDDKLLQTMFYSADSDNDSLSYFLEFDADCKRLYGSISGGSAYKFILFQRKEDGVWMTGTPIHSEKLTEEQALALGKSIRDYLVKGAEVIEQAELNTPEDYEALDKKLNEETDGKCTFAWVHKYYTILFPDKLTSYHSPDWQRHVLYALRIRPSETYYGRDGQISLVRKLCDLDYPSFGTAFVDKFGEIKKFIRLGTTDNDGNHYAEELRRDGAIGIGWNAVGPLSDYLTGNKINRKALAEALRDNYSSKNNVASRKAGEMATFYEATDDSVFVAMDGERMLAFVDGIGDNYFKENTELGHRRSGTWHLSFNDNEALPNPAEGHMTSCYQLSKEENLMFLYEKYYYGEEEGDEKMNLNKAYHEPVYHTGLKTDYQLNRIVFGAPGTGKSYRLEEERKSILQENPDNPKQHIGDYERVTFHPDYTYSQFVGTYKPVSEGRDIYYKFVPGPFMRVYVKAIKNGIETAENGNPEPFVLLIEEINRAPVSAVFGDVFQLLDRDDNGISQYEIEASEDIRRYLADELGGDPDDYQKIKIPDNMFIWASMNSADQGVFPMDTAFKRRWDFTYIGVNDNEDKIKGKYVVIGSSKRQRVEWNSLRRAINNFLARNKINEDKQLGPFFLSKDIVAPEGNEIDSEKFNDAFANKVIMYLFEDAARQRRSQLFRGCSENSNSYSEICREYRNKGIGIFNEEINIESNPENLPDGDTMTPEESHE